MPACFPVGAIPDMRIAPGAVRRGFADLGVVFYEADTDDRALIRQARLDGDLGPLLDHIARVDPEITATRSLLLHAAIKLSLVNSGVFIDSLVEDISAARALFDVAVTRPDIYDHITPALRAQFRGRLSRMAKRAATFSAQMD